MYGFRLHTINYIGRHFITISQFINIHYVRRTLNGSPHGVVIILANKDHRQLPDRRQVQRLVKVAAVQGAITEGQDNDPIVVARGCDGRLHGVILAPLG